MGVSASELAQFKDEGPIITQERLLRILKIVEGTCNVSVDEVVDKSGSEKGDGFLSDISDVNVIATVNGEIKEYKWMVKSTPREPTRWVYSRLFLKSDEREVKFFRDVLPKLKSFATSKDKGNLLPSFCHAPFVEWSEVDKVLVMQNLKQVGYRDAINKKDGLDLSHVTLVIKWLASFHALSYAYIDQYEGGIEQMKADGFDIYFWKWSDIPNIDATREHIIKFIGCTNADQLKLMSQIDGIFGDNKTYYTDMFQNIIDKFGSLDALAMKLFNEPEFSGMKLRTFNHGDTWFNNMLFKYNDDQGSASRGPVDVKLIDLQIVAYLPPVLDLTYLIFSSTTKEIRQSLPDLLKIYYDIFISNVNQLGSVLPYSYQEFFDDFKRASFYGFNFAMGPLKSQFDEKEDMFDVDDFAKQLGGTDMSNNEVRADFEKETEKRKNGAKPNTVYLKRIKEIMDDFVSMEIWSTY